MATCRTATALAAGLLITTALAACNSKSAATPTTSSGGSDSADDNYPCSLLTREQAATVVPNHEGGIVMHAGGSLIKGVDAYQCTWLDRQSNGLTVILNVAADEARFEEIKPAFSLIGSARKLAIGDGAWHTGSADDAKITAMKGHTVLELRLMQPGAAQKVPELETLTRAVTESVGKSR